MPNARQKSILHFHFIVFLFGFTSILGALIQIDALPLVAWRMGIASLLITLFFLVRNPKRFTGAKAQLKWLIAGGLMIGVHWITFFYAIKIAGVSLTLSMMASGAFLTALLEPLFYRRKIVLYELFFGAIALLGLLLIFNAEFDKLYGILIALLSAVLSVFFTLINGKLAQRLPASTVTFYELTIGFVALTAFCLWYNDFSLSPFVLQGNDWVYLLILGSICTAYAFIVSVQVMQQLTPFTIMIIINMEPIYGILMALVIFGEKELMSTNFYIGVVLILLAIASNGYLKSKQKST
jgi:drug/metabolite transporter (DMT)-like permease